MENEKDMLKKEKVGKTKVGIKINGINEENLKIFSPMFLNQCGQKKKQLPKSKIFSLEKI